MPVTPPSNALTLFSLALHAVIVIIETQRYQMELNQRMNV